MRENKRADERNKREIREKRNQLIKIKEENKKKMLGERYKQQQQ